MQGGGITTRNSSEHYSYSKQERRRRCYSAPSPCGSPKCDRRKAAQGLHIEIPRLRNDLDFGALFGGPLRSCYQFYQDITVIIPITKLFDSLCSTHSGPLLVKISLFERSNSFPFLVQLSRETLIVLLDSKYKVFPVCRLSVLLYMTPPTCLSLGDFDLDTQPVLSQLSA